MKMPDDNSCLFHGVAWLLDPPEAPSPPGAMRAAIVRAVRSDPSRWCAATLGKASVEEYCAFISDPTKWGGQVELCILAEAYATEIAVTDIQSGRIDVYGSGAGFQRRCYLVFTGIHFDAVEVSGVRTVLARDCFGADAAVAQLASEQRAAGGFTDQTTMRLR